LFTFCRFYDVRVETNPTGYFNAMLISKQSTIEMTDAVEWSYFENSKMERHYLLQKLTISGFPVIFITSHLESLKDYAKERQSQLKECFGVMLKQPKTHNVVFAGDLNLRAEDLRKVGGIPATISDAWESSGECTDVKFTWDLELNDNKVFPWGKPRARYDRMYFKRGSNKQIQCVDFQLVGTKRLESCKMFPSDHFGILSKFLLVCN